MQTAGYKRPQPVEAFLHYLESIKEEREVNKMKATKKQSLSKTIKNSASYARDVQQVRARIREIKRNKSLNVHSKKMIIDILEASYEYMKTEGVLFDTALNRVLTSRELGLEGETFTLAESALILGVTKERIRQLENSALKKLKHPKVGRRLLSFF